MAVFKCVRRGVLCEMLGGSGPPGHWNPYLEISEGHIHTAYRWEYDPQALKCWHSRVSINIIILRVRRFVYLTYGRIFNHVVVLHLLRRGTNFHSNKHSRSHTQDGLVTLRKVRTSWPQRTSSAYFANSCTCSLFLFSSFSFPSGIISFSYFQPAWRSQFQTRQIF